MVDRPWGCQNSTVQHTALFRQHLVEVFHGRASLQAGDDRRDCSSQGCGTLVHGSRVYLGPLYARTLGGPRSRVHPGPGCTRNPSVGAHEPGKGFRRENKRGPEGSGRPCTARIAIDLISNVGVVRQCGQGSRTTALSASTAGP